MGQGGGGGLAGPPPRRVGGDRAGAALREAGRAREELRRAEKARARAAARAARLEGELAGAQAEVTELRWSGAKLSQELATAKEAAREARARGGASLASLSDRLTAAEALVARRAAEGYRQVSGIHVQLQALQAAVMGGAWAPGAGVPENGAVSTPPAGEVWLDVQRRFGAVMEAHAELLATLAGTEGGCLLELQLERGLGLDGMSVRATTPTGGRAFKEGGERGGTPLERHSGRPGVGRELAQKFDEKSLQTQEWQRGGGAECSSSHERVGGEHSPGAESDTSPRIIQYRAAISKAQAQVAALHQRLEESAQERAALRDALRFSHTGDNSVARRESRGLESDEQQPEEQQQSNLREELDRTREELRVLGEASQGRIEAERRRANDLEASRQKDVELLQKRCDDLEDRLREARNGAETVAWEELKACRLDLASAQEKTAQLEAALEAAEAASLEEQRSGQAKIEALRMESAALDAGRPVESSSGEPSLAGPKDATLKQADTLVDVLGEIRKELSLGQAAGQDAAEKAQREREALRAQVAELRTGLTSSQKSADAHSEAHALRELVSDLQARARETSTSPSPQPLPAEGAQNRLADLEREVAALREERPQLAQAAKEIAEKDQQLQKKEEALSKMQVDVRKAEAELVAAQAELAALRSQMPPLEEALRRAEARDASQTEELRAFREILRENAGKHEDTRARELLLESKEEAIQLARRKEEALEEALGRLQEQQRLQREMAANIQEAGKDLEENQIKLASSQAEVCALQEERAKLLLRMSAQEEEFAVKQAEVTALKGKLDNQNQGIRRMVALAGSVEEPGPFVSSSLAVTGAFTTALESLGKALAPSEDGCPSLPERGKAGDLLDEAHEVVAQGLGRQGVPGAEYVDVLEHISRLGLHLPGLGSATSQGTAPWSARDPAHSPPSGGWRPLRREMDALDQEIAQIQAQSGLLAG